MWRSALFAMSMAVACAWNGAWATPLTAFSERFEGRFEFQVPERLVLQGDLRLPQGPGPFPVVVLMHGGGGVSPLEEQDVADLIPRGYATLVIDSFSGRGFKAAAGATAGSGPRPLERVADAYVALSLLSTHPQIDAKRAVLFGRSHGAMAAMLASTAWAGQKYGVASGPMFKGFVALYPVCNTVFPEWDALAAPLRVHVANKDELAPSKDCEQLVATMRSLGQDATVTGYADAHHAFDRNAPVSYVAQWINYGACRFELASIEAVPAADEYKRCVRRGASVGGNPAATVLMRQNRAVELEALLR